MDALHFGTYAHTATAQHASCIMFFYQGRSEIGLKCCAVNGKWLFGNAKFMAQILEAAFASFVTDRAFQRMVKQNVLNGFFPQPLKLRGLCGYCYSFLYRRSTCSHGVAHPCYFYHT
jgi:hypothetical protein